MRILPVGAGWLSVGENSTETGNDDALGIVWGKSPARAIWMACDPSQVILSISSLSRPTLVMTKGSERSCPMVTRENAIWRAGVTRMRASSPVSSCGPQPEAKLHKQMAQDNCAKKARFEVRPRRFLLFPNTAATPLAIAL